jgi:FMN reductase
MTKLTVILGSVTPPGRMNTALNVAVEAARAGGEVEAELINLADHKVAFADGRPLEQYGDDTLSIVDRVCAADAVILASPVYRGTYTGALKNLLDHLPVDALGGKPVGIVAMGATTHHYLGVDWHLRDVLTWFGALAAPTSIYLSSSDFFEGAPSDDARAELAGLVDTLVRLSALRTNDAEPLGPTPLAARYR